MGVMAPSTMEDVAAMGTLGEEDDGPGLGDRQDGGPSEGRRVDVDTNP